MAYCKKEKDISVQLVCETGLVYLGGEVVLLQLTSFPQVPGPHRVIQASGPQLGPVIRDVDAAGPVCVALELPADAQHTHTHRVCLKGR